MAPGVEQRVSIAQKKRSGGASSKGGRLTKKTRELQGMFGEMRVSLEGEEVEE